MLTLTGVRTPGNGNGGVGGGGGNKLIVDRTRLVLAVLGITKGRRVLGLSAGDVGDDAVILDTGKVQGGGRGTLAQFAGVKITGQATGGAATGGGGKILPVRITGRTEAATQSGGGGSALPKCCKMLALSHGDLSTVSMDGRLWGSRDNNLATSSRTSGFTLVGKGA